MDNIIFEWQLPDDHPNFTGFDDLPKAYCVVENKEAGGGVVIYADYGKGWEPNPWNTRTLVRHLIEKLNDEAL